MRLFRPLVVLLNLLYFVSALDFETADVPKTRHDYQSDVARMRRIVINSLYSHRDVFIRELLSNANDALEKLRIAALKDKTVWDGSAPLNITIKAVKDEDGKGGRLIITDTGIGMSPEDMTTNLGTLAKSGTADFLEQAESIDGTGTGNLIGAFGLGFYSSFLVADQVYVASIPYKSDRNPNPVQHVFSSKAEESSFDVFPDPRGNTMERGTEITLVLKNDATEFLDSVTLAKLINKHSGFTTSFPIYMYKQTTKEVPDIPDVPDAEDEQSSSLDASAVPPKSVDNPDEVDIDEASMDLPDEADVDEASVEELEEEPSPKDANPPKMKTVVVEEWDHLNAAPPLWQRDPKEIGHHEYKLFYKSTFKHFVDPLAWHHFSGDADGVAFKGIIFVPPELDSSFWAAGRPTSESDVRLMVKRVFITSDLGPEGLPKWLSWVKAIVDADDLPLNVSRETFQSTRFLKQIKQVIAKHILQLFARLATEDPETFDKLQVKYGTALKLGAVEDVKNRNKLVSVTRFSTNQRNSTSLDEYLENKKQGQKQIFYLAELGKPIPDLAKSVFVEKLHARGYEVLLVNEGLDEVLFQNLRQWKGFTFQDVAKTGLKFGDEDITPEEEKESQKALTEQFKPLLDWLKLEAQGVVQDVIISNRLVTSPCAVVADAHGYTANIEKLISASNDNKRDDVIHEIARKKKLLEINPRSPLIQGLLQRVNRLSSETSPEAEAELKEVASILIDGALVRSGFQVADSSQFYYRIDRVLRRSLGVSETAPTDTTVKPAPPVDPTTPEDEEGIPGEGDERISEADMEAAMASMTLDYTDSNGPKDVPFHVEGPVNGVKHDEL